VYPKNPPGFFWVRTRVSEHWFLFISGSTYLTLYCRCPGKRAYNLGHVRPLFDNDDDDDDDEMN